LREERRENKRAEKLPTPSQSPPLLPPLTLADSGAPLWQGSWGER